MLEILDVPFQMLSDASGLPLDQSKIAFCLISSYFFALIFFRLNGYVLRHFYSFSIGFLYQLIVYRYETSHPVIMSILVYLTLLILKKNFVLPVFVVCFSYLTGYQIYRYIQDWGSWVMDASFSLMILTGKLTALAWNLRDGKFASDKLSEDQNYRKVEKLPNIFEFMSYVFFFPGALIGPIFDYREFELLMRKEQKYANAPSGHKIGFIMLILGLIASFLFTVLSDYYNVAYILTQEFPKHNFFWQYYYISVVGFVLRCKFFTGFYLAQAAIDASGLSYSPSSDALTNWEGVLTCSRILEFVCVPRDALEAWNSSVQTWLKRYCYNRIMDDDAIHDRKPNLDRASKLTFALSAFWHGINPSYYISFAFGWLSMECGKAIYRAQTKLKLNHQLYLTIQYLVSRIQYSFILCNHFLYYVAEDWKLIKNTYMFPVMIALSLTVGLNTFVNKKKRSEKKTN